MIYFRVAFILYNGVVRSKNFVEITTLNIIDVEFPNLWVGYETFSNLTSGIVTGEIIGFLKAGLGNSIVDWS